MPQVQAPTTVVQVRVFCLGCLKQYTMLRRNYPNGMTTLCPVCGRRSPFVINGYQQVTPEGVNSFWETKPDEHINSAARRQVEALLAKMEQAGKEC